jgi:FKBP-type peptidyl-prolyl cis-trans isomerase 2
MQTPDGNPIPVQVTKVENGKATFDMNHPLAGKALNFEMELVEVREA